MKYKTCEKCGASLDFGERCDCEGSQIRVTIFKSENKPKSIDSKIGNVGQRERDAGQHYSA